MGSAGKECNAIIICLTFDVGYYFFIRKKISVFENICIDNSNKVCQYYINGYKKTTQRGFCKMTSKEYFSKLEKALNENNLHILEQNLDDDLIYLFSIKELPKWMFGIQDIKILKIFKYILT